MSVAALSTAGFTNFVNSSSQISASQQAYNSLAQALNSGNLSSAQTAFTQFQKYNASSSNSQLTTDIATLGSALSSGKLSTAQTAFSTVQNDLKSSPSQALTAAESAASQTVGWIDDLLNLPNSSTQQTATADPTTNILNSAYGQSSNSATNASSTGTSTTGSGSSTATSGSNVNVYA